MLADMHWYPAWAQWASEMAKTPFLNPKTWKTAIWQSWKSRGKQFFESRRTLSDLTWFLFYFYYQSSGRMTAQIQAIVQENPISTLILENIFLASDSRYICSIEIVLRQSFGIGSFLQGVLTYSRGKSHVQNRCRKFCTHWETNKYSLLNLANKLYTEHPLGPYRTIPTRSQEW